MNFNKKNIDYQIYIFHFYKILENPISQLNFETPSLNSNSNIFQTENYTFEFNLY